MNHIMRKVEALKKRGYWLPRWGGHSTRKMVTGAVTGASLIKSSLPSQEVTYRQFLIIPRSSRIFLPKGIFLPTEPALALGRWEVQGGKNEEQQFMDKYLMFSLQWHNSVACSTSSRRVYCRLGFHGNYSSTHPSLAFFPSLSHSLTFSLCFLGLYAKKLHASHLPSY